MFGFLKKSKLVEVNEVEITHKEEFDNIEIVAKYFKNETGVAFDKQMSILNNKTKIFCKKRKIYSFVKLLELIKTDAKLKQELVDYLTTNETYFYRETGQIDQLVKLVQESSSKVSILCAPSATGEEPYSIAIALLEAGVLSTNFSILGIDINQEAITKATASIYRERNLRKLTPQIVDKYFVKEGEHYVLKQSIKSLVTFKVINIFDASFGTIGKFDFVFSRNMLIYFDKETKEKAKQILEGVRKNDKCDVFFGHADLFS